MTPEAGISQYELSDIRLGSDPWRLAACAGATAQKVRGQVRLNLCLWKALSGGQIGSSTYVLGVLS
jgi:hypothetical protein